MKKFRHSRYSWLFGCICLGAFALSAHVPFTFPRTYEASLHGTKPNATVTLVRSLNTDKHVTEVAAWVRAVQHLAPYMCILVDSESYGVWLASALSEQILAETMENVRIINVAGEFSACNTRPAPGSKCVENNYFSHGYKRMCRLWYSAVWSYLSDYEYILRFDLDNVYGRGDWPVNIEHVGTVTCIDGDNSNYMVGLKETLWGPDIARRGRSPYPYTNVFFVNVQWVLHEPRLRHLFDLVDESNCVCVNRWGDLPLWGESLSKLGIRVRIMQDWAYLHGSHNSEISGATEKGMFC